MNRIYHVSEWRIGDARGQGGGYGFATANRARVFVHASVLCEHLRPARGATVPIGTVVYIETAPEKEGDRGPRATKALCAECAVPPQWDWRPTGKTATDPVTRETVAEVEPVQIAGRKTYDPPPPFTWKAQWERNSRYREVERRAKLWAHGALKDVVVEFGEPTTIVVDDEYHVAAMWPHGERKVSVEVAIDLWGLESATGDIRITTRETYRIAEVLVRVRNVGEPLWLRVAEVGTAPSAYVSLYKRSAWDVIESDLRAAVSAALAPLVPSPEACAEVAFSDDHQKYARQLWEKYQRCRAALYSGPLSAKEHNWSGRVTVSYPESDDGYRPAGSYEARGGKSWIVVRATPRDERRMEAVLGTRWQELASFDAGLTSSKVEHSEDSVPEERRDALLAMSPEEHREKFLHGLLDEFLRALPRRSENSDLLPIDWLNRYNARWNELFRAAYDPSEWDRAIAWLQFNESVPVRIDDPGWTPDVIEARYIADDPAAMCYGVAVLNTERRSTQDPILVSRWTLNRKEAEFWAALMRDGMPTVRDALAQEARVVSLTEQAVALCEAKEGPYAPYRLNRLVEDAQGGRLSPDIGSPWERSNGVSTWIAEVEGIILDVRTRREEARRERERQAQRAPDNSATNVPTNRSMPPSSGGATLGDLLRAKEGRRGKGR